MYVNEFKSILDSQRRFFASGATLPLAFRIEQLQKLKSLIQIHEVDIVKALKADLNKHPVEATFNEVLLVTAEIDFIIKHLKNWIRPKKVSTPLPLWPGRSEIRFEPYGIVLIISPWNYPFLLLMSPLIGAMCAGNCAIVKPSEVASNTQNLIVQLIKDHFSPEYIAAIKIPPEHMQQLLQEKFDYIFFTGGTHIGKIVMEAAAKHLTPITLELGGKSPCIVDETVDLNFTARRIAWGKWTNAGQTCIAPDYIYVHRSKKDTFIELLKHAIAKFYSADAQKSPYYGRIINKKHFERLMKLMQKGDIVFGGQNKEDELYVAPTIIENITWQDPVMQEEIFGPILPILIYDELNEVIQAIRSQPKPLAIYLFTKNKATQNKVLDQTSFGNACINDCLVHMMNLNLPFGGVGDSGLSHYHGKYSFETFSHAKGIYKKSALIDLKLEYPPYTERKLWWLRRLLK